MKLKLWTIAAVVAVFASAADAEAAGLRGSITSMRTQHKVATERELTFIGSAADVRRVVAGGELEHVPGNGDYKLASVSHPYAVKEVKLFIERLGAQYHAANGAPLVVTSLVRPEAEQPRNAHTLSVHPAGMAVDLRVPQDPKARAWLEKVLLQLENAGVLDVTRERYPPHYHVAVFPEAYARYVERLPPRPVAASAPEVTAEAAIPVTVAPAVGPHAMNAAGSMFSPRTALITGAAGALLLLAGVPASRLFSRSAARPQD